MFLCPQGCLCVGVTVSVPLCVYLPNWERACVHLRDCMYVSGERSENPEPWSAHGQHLYMSVHVESKQASHKSPVQPLQPPQTARRGPTHTPPPGPRFGGTAGLQRLGSRRPPSWGWGGCSGAPRSPSPRSGAGGLAGTSQPGGVGAAAMVGGLWVPGRVEGAGPWAEGVGLRG